MLRRWSTVCLRNVRRGAVPARRARLASVSQDMNASFHCRKTDNLSKAQSIRRPLKKSSLTKPTSGITTFTDSRLGHAATNG